MNSNINKLNQVVYQFLKNDAPNYSVITRSNIIRNLVKNTVKIAKIKSEDLTQLQPISALGASIEWDEADTDKFHLSYGNLRISEDSDTNDDKITYVFPDWPEATVEKLLPDNKDSSRQFGQSVDADGDYLVIGDPAGAVGFHYGKVYVYYKPTMERTELTPSFEHPRTQYGKIVKIKGDYCAIISKGVSGTGIEDKDRLFIFKRTGINTWIEEFNYLFSRANQVDSVSISGDYVIVSRNEYSNESKATIFYRDATDGWEFNSEILQPYSALTGEIYKCLIAADGNYLAVNFRNEEVNGYNNAGAIYIYEKTGTNTWGNEYKITSPNLKSYSDHSDWGESMSLNGDYLGIKDDFNNFYIYRRSSANIWDDQFSFTMSDGYYQYGSICIKGDTCLVMSQSVYQGDDFAAGEVTIFERTDINTWTEVRKIWSPVPIQQSYFGFSAATGNNFIIVGNYNDIDIGDVNHGSAWLFSY